MIGYINHPKMDGKGLVVNDPVHLAQRPTKRMLKPAALENPKGEASKANPADYYTSDGCKCGQHW